MEPEVRRLNIHLTLNRANLMALLSMIALRAVRGAFRVLCLSPIYAYLIKKHESGCFVLLSRDAAYRIFWDVSRARLLSCVLWWLAKYYHPQHRWTFI